MKDGQKRVGAQVVVNISKSCITSALPTDAHLPILSAFQQW